MGDPPSEYLTIYEFEGEDAERAERVLAAYQAESQRLEQAAAEQQLHGGGWRGLVPGGAGVRRLAPSAPSAAVQVPYSSRTQWYVVLLLTMAATLSFIDRQILNVMIGPIKRDLGGLSDTEISLIIGLAFSLVYTLATVPLARMADRGNRRNIIAAGIFAWSLATALAGKADSFRSLFCGAHGRRRRRGHLGARFNLAAG